MAGAGAGGGVQPARRFALRRVNPFLGIVAVVKTDSARALSLDGLHWQIQILAHPPRGLWSGDGESDKLQYFRFGVWSEAQGLRRVPLNPILNLDHMLKASDALCEQIAASLDEIPFPLAPELEQWLLDADGMPLALIAATPDAPGLDPAGVAETGAADWSAGGRGERTFRAPTLTRPGAADSNRLAHVEALERLVRRRSGTTAQGPVVPSRGRRPNRPGCQCPARVCGAHPPPGRLSAPDPTHGMAGRPRCRAGRRLHRLALPLPADLAEPFRRDPPQSRGQRHAPRPGGGRPLAPLPPGPGSRPSGSGPGRGEAAPRPCLMP